MTAGPGSFTKSLILDNYRGGDLNTISSNDKVYRLVSKSIQMHLSAEAIIALAFGFGSIIWCLVKFAFSLYQKKRITDLEAQTFSKRQMTERRRTFGTLSRSSSSWESSIGSKYEKENGSGISDWLEPPKPALLEYHTRW